jgi:hypothetical protein
MKHRRALQSGSKRVNPDERRDELRLHDRLQGNALGVTQFGLGTLCGSGLFSLLHGSPEILEAQR